MELLFDMYGEAILSAVAAAAMIIIISYFIFSGPLAQYMFDVLSSMIR